MQIPFQQLSTAVRALTTVQKLRLQQELGKEKLGDNDNAAFMNMLVSEPVFTEKEIQTIEENTKSIAKWRTKG